MLAGHGELLQRKIRLTAPLAEGPSARFWDHERIADLFPRFLVTIHGSVRATIPLMEAATYELRQRSHSDQLRAPLIEYFEQHAAEEMDHEEWLLQDLEAIGIARGAVLERVATPAIASLVGAQYYWIRHAHPVALLGLFAVLEGHPPTLVHLEDLERRTGLPSDAFRMLRHHAELDQEHGDELFRLLDRLPLSAVHSGLLGVSAFHTLGALGAMFEELLGGAGTVDPLRADRTAYTT